MTHEELRDRLLDLAYGELSPRDAREVEAHAASCDACGAELARIRGTRRLMASLPQEPAPERGERILVAAAREAARRRTPRPWVPRWAWATAVAAASLVAVAAVSWRIVAMRPGGVGREDPRALMGDSPYAREPGDGAPRDAKRAEREDAPRLGDAREKAAPPSRDGASPRPPSPPRGGGEGRGEGARPSRAAPARRYAAAPPPEPPPPAASPPEPSPPAASPERAPERAPERSEYAAAPPIPAEPSPSAAAPSRPPPSEERPMAMARPQHRAMSKAAPPQAAGEAARDEAVRPPPSPAALLRYEDLRRTGRLRGEIRTFPGCDGEAWRKVERDPDGRVVSYAREGLVGGRRVRVDVVYGPDGAPARVTVRDAATMALLDATKPWIPRAADADGPPRCAE